MRCADGCRDQNRDRPRSKERVGPADDAAAAAGRRSAVLAAFAGTASKQIGFVVAADDDVAAAVAESCADNSRASTDQTVGSEIDCQT